MSAPSGQVPAWLLPTGLGVLVIVLVTVALLRGPVELDPDSPEGTVQEYLVAISEERWDDAIEVIHEDWREGCDGADIASFSPDSFSAELGSASGFNGRVIREEFVAIPSEDGTAPPDLPEPTTSVEVTIDHGGQGGLGSGWNEGVVFELVDDGEFWWLTGDPWPYFTWSCRDQ